MIVAPSERNPTLTRNYRILYNMTMTITVEEATTSLLDLLERVSHGEDFTILKDGREVARLLPSITSLPPRVPGTAAGMIKIASDFDAPLPDDILVGFQG